MLRTLRWLFPLSLWPTLSPMSNHGWPKEYPPQPKQSRRLPPISTPDSCRRPPRPHSTVALENPSKLMYYEAEHNYSLRVCGTLSPYRRSSGDREPKHLRRRLSLKYASWMGTND